MATSNRGAAPLTGLSTSGSLAHLIGLRAPGGDFTGADLQLMALAGSCLSRTTFDKAKIYDSICASPACAAHGSTTRTSIWSAPRRLPRTSRALTCLAPAAS